jgi:hypothetical protein
MPHPNEPSTAEAVWQSDRSAITRAQAGRPRTSVGFLIHAPETLSALEPVIAELEKKAAQFDLYFFAIPRNYSGIRGQYTGAAETLAILKQKFPQAESLQGESEQDRERLKSLGLDYIFRQSPWEQHIPPIFAAAALSFTRLCYIPYGMMTAKIPQQQYNQALHNQCHMIFCESDFHLSEYKSYRSQKTDNVYDTGYPRLEFIIQRLEALQAQGRPAEYWPIEAGRELPKLIWAPHHSLTKDWLNYSNFLNYKDLMLAHAQAGKISILFRPHPALCEKLTSSRLMTEAQYLQYLAAFNATGTSQLDTNKDYIETFHGSDFMVTDGVGFFSEYILTNKPLIHTSKAFSNPLNTFGNWVTSSFRKARNAAELNVVLQEISEHRYPDLERDDRLARSAILQSISMGASQRIVDHLQQQTATVDQHRRVA